MPGRPSVWPAPWMAYRWPSTSKTNGSRTWVIAGSSGVRGHRLAVLLPDAHLPVAAGEQHLGAVRGVGHRAVDGGGHAGVVDDAAAPAAVRVQLARAGSPGRSAPAASAPDRWSSTCPHLIAGVHRRVRVVLEEHVVAAVDVRAAVRVVDPTAVRATVQPGERWVRMLEDHAHTVTRRDGTHGRGQ